MLDLGGMSAVLPSSSPSYIGPWKELGSSVAAHSVETIRSVRGAFTKMFLDPPCIGVNETSLSAVKFGGLQLSIPLHFLWLKLFSRYSRGRIPL